MGRMGLGERGRSRSLLRYTIDRIKMFGSIGYANHYLSLMAIYDHP
jgi:hypothetical protein